MRGGVEETGTAWVASAFGSLPVFIFFFERFLRTPFFFSEVCIGVCLCAVSRVRRSFGLFKWPVVNSNLRGWINMSNGGTVMLMQI